MMERVFTRDKGRYKRGQRLNLSSAKEWANWFPGFESFTKETDDLIEGSLPRPRGRPRSEERANA